jgi:poly(3-hydroxybutyrate) depolymerase
MSKRFSPLLAASSAVLLSISFSACSSTDNPANMGGAGAPPSTAGANSTAGSPGTAGTPGVSGASATGGSPGTAGASGSGTTAGASGSGTTAGAGGTGGSGGAPATGTGSPGCKMDPQPTDSATAWVKHDIEVTGVDPAFVTKYPPNAGTTYNWTHRNYYLKLPTNYDATKQYPITIGGSGCGGPETVGAEGGYAPLGNVANQDKAIMVSLSYVLSKAAMPDCGGAVFADDYPNSPEVQYLAAVVKDVQSKYCNATNKVFLGGYSSGAFESVSLGCASSDIIRGYGVQIGGGLRINGPKPCKGPTAAIFVVGLQDDGNPIGPLATPLNDSLGTAPARDELLTRNQCVGTDTEAWDPDYPKCVKYKGCPAKYPVVWCAIDSGHLPDKADPAVGKYRYDGVWKFWSTLPDK